MTDSPFAKFIREAPESEKRRVYERVMDRACKDQVAAIKKARASRAKRG